MARSVQIARFEAQIILDQVVPIEDPDPIREFEAQGFSFVVKMNSLRYHLFRKNPTCVACGITGSFMLLEASPNGDPTFLHKTGSRNAFFSLYAHDELGNRVFLTQDHILPKSRGGKDELDNLQTMCEPCNGFKSNLPLEPEQVKKLREAERKIRLSPLTGAEMRAEIRKLIEIEIQGIVVTPSRIQEVLSLVELPDDSWHFVLTEGEGGIVSFHLRNATYWKSKKHVLRVVTSEEEVLRVASKMLPQGVLGTNKEHIHAIL